MFNLFKSKKFDPQKIIKAKDAKALCKLNSEDFNGLAIALVYDYYLDMPFESLNADQKTLFLCMSVEDSCEADGILSLLENENVFFALPEAVDELFKISSPITAKALDKFIDLMPKGTFENRVMPEYEWFSENAEREEAAENIEAEITEYPDGYTGELLWEYFASSIDRAKSLLDVMK
ncbi:MAG: hypothetical protein IKK70_07150 [Clostridia bacterium]|nr:hypothetical protein [Clostridia bacterium]